MTTPAFGTFFLPGPTEVHAEVLAAMLRPMMPHRGAAFEALFARCVRGLQTVFRTTRPVYVSSSSATGLMEGAVRAAPPGPILALVNGAFSERFARIATACGRETELMQVPLGASFDLGAVRAQLAARAWAAITVVHSETSTGVLTDVHALTVLAHEFDVPCLVDSVTGVGGTPVEADGWALDFVLTGSQKALALPPGLAFGVASERFIAQAKSGVARGVYFDLVEFESYGAKHQTPNTPALSLLYALDAQLPRIAAEGIEGRWARHAAMADATHAWVAALAQRTGRAFGILAAPGQRSHTVTAVTVPDGLDGQTIVKSVAARGYVIGDGYGSLKGRTFRIGHMGDHTLATLAGCLAACDSAVDDVLAARA